jgi:tetraacyldisaccharide 4'-kinase
MKFKKPKFWDLSQPNILAYLLLPFTLPIRLNNLILYFKSKKKIKKLKTICVGNIYLGGTGKTPTVIKLFEIIKKLNFDVVTAKKFYSSHKDEIILLKKKTNLITAPNRQNIIDIAFNNNNKIVVFDDGLQDGSIDYDLKFVCFDTKSWLGNGCLIPSGPLREKINSLKKYDAVFLKNNYEKNFEIIETIKKYNPQINIFNTKYIIKNLDKINIKEKYLIFSGIGNPDDFKNVLIKNNFDVVNEIVFPDHYKYKYQDILNIKKKAKQINAKIITTEKDFVKIPMKDRNEINFLEIDLKIIEEENLSKFLKLNIHE